MKVKDCMTKSVIAISQEETADVAARMMSRGNVGALPVRGRDGKTAGIVTDRDIILRCVAAQRDPMATPVKAIMSTPLTAAAPEMDIGGAAALMAREQVRRLPVLDGGRLVGMVSLGDLSRMPDYTMEAGECLADVCAGIHSMESDADD